MTATRLFAQMRFPGVESAARRFREFFAYHGIWAPGVRALRLWTMRRKVLVLVFVMAVPLVPLVFSQFQHENRIVDQVGRKVGGIAIAEAAFGLAAAIEQQRQAIDAGRAFSGQAIEARQQMLAQRIESDHLIGPLVISIWQAQRALIARASSAESMNAAMRAEALRVAQAALYPVAGAAVDASGLMLSDDEEIAALTDIALRQLPALQLHLGRVVHLVQRQAALAERDPQPTAEMHAGDMQAAVAADRAAQTIYEVERLLAGVDLEQRDRLRALLAQTRELLARVDPAAGAAAPRADIATVRQVAQRLSTAIAALREQQVAQVSGHLGSDLADARNTRVWLIAANAAVLAIAAYLTYSFFIVMQGGLGALNLQMQRMAMGDLSARPVPLGNDEVAHALGAMTTSLSRLSDLMASVRQGVAAVFQASQQIAAGNTDLSGRTRRSGEGLTQIVGGIERYTAQLQACAERVESVVSTVQALRLESARNRKQMARLEERLEALHGKSHEIGEIVRLIDTIAFRTNILALNASVEASKAGPAGRGFAFVAQEVRALALRSADSAQRIGEVIGRSSTDIDDSAALAGEAGRSIRESDRHVDKIHAAVSEVADMTQRSGAEAAAILEELKLLQDAASKNLDLVDRLAVASDALRGQGERLSHRIGLFKLN